MLWCIMLPKADGRAVEALMPGGYNSMSLEVEEFVCYGMCIPWFVVVLYVRM